MMEITPDVVDTAFLYFHTRCSSGDEIGPFVDDIRKELPNMYIWAGDGCIEGKGDDPIMGKDVSYGTSSQRFWFVFPMQGKPSGCISHNEHQEKEGIKHGTVS